jgi:hypothetical protein
VSPKLIQGPASGSLPMSNPTDHNPTENARFLVESPDRFAIARWSRDADVATICRCILATLKYEPHAVDTAVLRRALEGVIEHTARGGEVDQHSCPIHQEPQPAR